MNPWENEPDRLEFQSHGFDCLILRAKHLGSLCGYVGLTESHPAYGRNYQDNMLCGIDVHGGLTWSDKGDGEHRPANRWWFGFDCAHSGDYCPTAEKRYAEMGMPRLSEPYVAYRNIRYVQRETEHLAEQLAALTNIEELGHA